MGAFVLGAFVMGASVTPTSIFILLGHSFSRQPAGVLRNLSRSYMHFDATSFCSRKLGKYAMDKLGIDVVTRAGGPR